MMEYATDAPIYQEYTNRVSIIIPAYNEENRISSVLNDVTEFISKNRVDWNIIIAIDGDDQTSTIVSNFKKSFPL